MEKQTQEWFRQSDYDMDTAEYMYQGGRYIYTVFMCHLSIEKALKVFISKSTGYTRQKLIALLIL